VAPPAAGSLAAPLQAVVEAARREGELVLLWSGLENPEGVHRLVAGFNRTYGLDVRVRLRVV
jgi:hypothetical protein